MSRTDKTAPLRVKMFYYPRWVHAQHDHANGVCELPELATPSNIFDYDTLVLYMGEWVEWSKLGWRYTHWLHKEYGVTLPSCHTCYWAPAHEIYSTGMGRCGCPMCQQQDWKHEERRKARRAARRYCQSGWMKEY